MRKPGTVAAAVLLLLSACVVVRGERPAENGGRGEPPPLPEVQPIPLVPGADAGPVGGLGWALLSPDVPQAVIEVDTAANVSLHDQTLARLEDALRQHGGKQVRRHPASQAAAREVYDVDDLRSLAEQHRDASSHDDTTSVYVLVLPGRFEQQGVTGVSFAATAFAVFAEEVAGRLPRGANVAAFEEAVVIHELGHLFGLVNLTGNGAFHEDPEHPGHTDDDSSVMYWAVESVAIAEVFGAGPPSDFTEDDRREMGLIRGNRPR